MANALPNYTGQVNNSGAQDALFLKVFSGEVTRKKLQARRSRPSADLNGRARRLQPRELQRRHGWQLGRIVRANGRARRGCCAQRAAARQTIGGRLSRAARRIGPRSCRLGASSHEARTPPGRAHDGRMLVGREPRGAAPGRQRRGRRAPGVRPARPVDTRHGARLLQLRLRVSRRGLHV